VKELTQIEKVLLLRSVDLFVHCRAEEVIRLAAIAQVRDFEKDAEIFRVNEASEALYCLVEGRVLLDDGNGSRRAIEPGETFGVHGILSGRLRRVTAIADLPSRTLALDADDFFDLLSNNIEIVKALFREVTFSEDGPRQGPR